VGFGSTSQNLFYLLRESRGLTSRHFAPLPIPCLLVLVLFFGALFCFFIGLLYRKLLLLEGCFILVGFPKDRFLVCFSRAKVPVRFAHSLLPYEIFPLPPSCLRGVIHFSKKYLPCKLFFLFFGFVKQSYFTDIPDKYHVSHADWFAFCPQSPPSCLCYLFPPSFLSASVFLMMSSFQGGYS